MNKRNYQKELDKLIERNQKEGKIPRLFLHACCAPCSSYVMEYLSQYFEITIFFYNPNIAPVEEYSHRVAEIRRLIGEMEFVHPVTLVEGRYDPEEFYELAKGLEDVPEGGERCFRCYRLRMEEAAKLAKEGGYDYFTTTLSISPLKNAQKINEIGEELAEIYKVPHLTSDFKKKNGYKRSIELSHEHALYRQNYCGCVFSKKEAMDRERLVTENRVNSNNGRRQQTYNYEKLCIFIKICYTNTEKCRRPGDGARVCPEKTVLPQKRKVRKNQYGTVMGRPFYKRNGQAGLQF